MLASTDRDAFRASRFNGGALTLMDGSIQISVGSIFAVVAFLLQVGLTVGAIAFSHGQVGQRVRAVEEKIKEWGDLSTSVTRLETEMEVVSREIKGLRADLRRILFSAAASPSSAAASQRRSPFDFAGAREWVLEDEQ